MDIDWKEDFYEEEVVYDVNYYTIMSMGNSVILTSSERVDGFNGDAKIVRDFETFETFDIWGGISPLNDRQKRMLLTSSLLITNGYSASSNRLKRITYNNLINMFATDEIGELNEI